MALIGGVERLEANQHLILLGTKEMATASFLEEKEVTYVNDQFERKTNQIEINQYNRWIFVQRIDKHSEEHERYELLRKAGAELHAKLQSRQITDITVVDMEKRPDDLIAFVEGLALSNYRFTQYVTDEQKQPWALQHIDVYSFSLGKDRLAEINAVIQGVYNARDMVNEPLSVMNAEKLASEATRLGNEAGFHVSVLDQKQIEAYQMGGLLAVNRGSIDPPTFSVLEWKPANAVNSYPVVLVGKGIVYDTGGLSLKGTSNSMDEMKSDMSGAASVIGTMYALAALDIPVYVVGLIPGTDNRPDGNAYTPGDIVSMYDQTTVEVMNTDAEGRMVMADALSYAKQYNPELVIDIATLTGSAAIALGKYGIVGMGNASAKMFERLQHAGSRVYERVVRFPFWQEYGELLKSDIADMKNVGGREGGAITAGKFLEHFTASPYIHLDIAGTAFLKEKDSYRGKGGTGSGVRLLYEFIKQSSSDGFVNTA